jgi:hypothetical protein
LTPSPAPNCPKANNQTPSATYKGLDLYLTVHLVPPKPLILPMRAGWFVGGVAPWFVGLYFAYVTARAANKVLRSIGAIAL